MIIQPEILNEVVPKYLNDGWQMVCALTPSSPSPALTPTRQCVHAIGDKTNGAVLDALEVALEHTEVLVTRPRIEHAQIMDRKDIARLGKTGGTSGLFRRWENKC